MNEQKMYNIEHSAQLRAHIVPSWECNAIRIVFWIALNI